MATISITIPDATVSRVIPLLCAAGGFTDVTPANAKAAVMAYILRIVQSAEQQAARDAAMKAVVTPAPLALS